MVTTFWRYLMCISAVKICIVDSPVSRYSILFGVNLGRRNIFFEKNLRRLSTSSYGEMPLLAVTED